MVDRKNHAVKLNLCTCVFCMIACVYLPMHICKHIYHMHSPGEEHLCTPKFKIYFLFCQKRQKKTHTHAIIVNF